MGRCQRLAFQVVAKGTVDETIARAIKIR